MKLFLDTEFTDLVPHNKLISIALVDEDGEFFYAELTDTYELKDCSEFVKSAVLPFLKGGNYRMTSYECALKLGNWIEDKNKCIIINDNPGWDMPHLRRILNPIWPSNLEEYPNRIFVPDNIVESIVISHNLDIHNALDDAKIMMLAHKIGEAQEY